MTHHALGPCQRGLRNRSNPEINAFDQAFFHFLSLSVVAALRPLADAGGLRPPSTAALRICAPAPGRPLLLMLARVPAHHP